MFIGLNHQRIIYLFANPFCILHGAIICKVVRKVVCNFVFRTEEKVLSCSGSQG